MRGASLAISCDVWSGSAIRSRFSRSQRRAHSVFQGGVRTDGKYAWGRDFQDKVWLYPLDGSSPIAVAGLVLGDNWVNWGRDSRTAYIYTPTGSDNYPLRIFKLDPFTGNKKFLKEITPADDVGLGLTPAVRISRDEQSYAYTYERSLCELFLVSGLK